MLWKSIPLIVLLLVYVTACGQPPSLAARTLNPTAPVVDHADATTSAIVARQEALVAMMQATQTAQPTTTLTPTAPPNARACHAADLQGTASSNGATGSIEFVAYYTNVSSTLCVLLGPPRMQLLNHNGQPLDID